MLEEFESGVDEILEKVEKSPAHIPKTGKVSKKTKINNLNKKVEQLKEEHIPKKRFPKLINKLLERFGIVQFIRKELENINEQFTKNQGLANGKYKIDRIVLYIDDLDRCPPKRVVEVLQAIHLLLAFPLFVVVVGVDKRWVSHAIEEVYPNLNPTNNKKGKKIATSLDYLEKIFQIPYSLRPMDEVGIKKLLDNLLIKDLLIEKTEKENTIQTDTLKTVSATNSQDQDSKEEVITTSPIFKGKKLQITKAEKDYIHELAPILNKSPRAIKRFINTYRIVRVHQEGPENIDEYQGTLLLLAIMIGFPNASQSVFHQIATTETSTETKFIKLLKQIPPDMPPTTQELWDKLQGISQKTEPEPIKTLEIPISTLQRFLPLVTRFSFRMEA